MVASSVRIPIAAGLDAKLATESDGGSPAIHTLKTTTEAGGGSAGATLTDASIASASGSSETIAALSTTRNVLNVSNPGTTTWWINESGGTAAANGGGCFELRPGDRWTPRPAPRNAVTGIGTASSKLSVVVG